jgi:2-haloacid dehalogenase
MPDPVDATARQPVRGVLLDLLMAVMDSMEVWSVAAGDHRRGLEWRDAVTALMVAHQSYVSYEDLVAEAARELGLPRTAATDLVEGWPKMCPWPDAAAITRLKLPFGFVTNCSRALATIAAERSGLRPVFALSAEEAGCYKPDPRIYREACDLLMSPPTGTLLVAGSVYDSEGAQRAGLRASLVVRRTDQRRPASQILVVESIDQVVTWLERGTSNSGA